MGEGTTTTIGIADPLEGTVGAGTPEVEREEDTRTIITVVEVASEAIEARRGRLLRTLSAMRTEICLEGVTSTTSDPAGEDGTTEASGEETPTPRAGSVIAGAVTVVEAEAVEDTEVILMEEDTHHKEIRTTMERKKVGLSTKA